jgi:hypothetical protein
MTTIMGTLQSATALEVNKDDDPAHEEYESEEDNQQFTPYTAPTWQKSSKGRLIYEVPSASSDDDEEGEDLSFLLDAKSPQTSENDILTLSAEATGSSYGFSYDDWSDTSSENDILTPSAEAAKSGYGFSYDGWSNTSSSEHKLSSSGHVSSPPAIITKDSAPKPKDFVLQPKKSLIDQAMESAFDPNSPENRHLPASHFDKAEACGITAHKGKAIKPRTVLPRTPPTRGFLSANRDQILRGTSLSPLDEGDSIHSEQSGKTLYRVAETRKFHGEIKAQRTAKMQGRGKQPVQTPDKSPGQLEIDDLAQEIREDEEALGFTVPTSSITNQIIAATKAGTPRKSQSPKSEFSSPSASVETPSKKINAPQQARVDDGYEDDVLIPDEFVVKVEALQQQQDTSPWDSPILVFSPSDSGASVASEWHLDDTQSHLVTLKANRSTPDVVCTSPRSPKVVIVTPKKTSDASAPSQVLAITAEHAEACPYYQGLDIKLSPDGTAAMIRNPAPPATPTPAKRPRSCRPKTPKAPKSPKMSDSAGVDKRGPNCLPKTPTRVLKENRVEFVRQSARKTAYRGKFGQ